MHSHAGSPLDAVSICLVQENLGLYSVQVRARCGLISCAAFASLELVRYGSVTRTITVCAYNRDIDKRLARKLVWLRETNYVSGWSQYSIRGHIGCVTPRGDARGLTITLSPGDRAVSSWRWSSRIL